MVVKVFIYFTPSLYRHDRVNVAYVLSKTQSIFYTKIYSNRLRDLNEKKITDIHGYFLIYNISMDIDCGKNED